MSSHHQSEIQPWRLPMLGRNPNETHRQASFLELFFDLCFVVAIAQAAAQLHHAIAGDHLTSGIISFSMVFFAIWWAWMNFTWFASAYDNDDVPFRIATLTQIVGALILAAGVQRGFVDQNFNIIFIGYLVMRLGLVTMWVRAGLSDPEHKTTNFRYAFGISAAMLGWGAMFITGYWPIWAFALMAFIELLIPIWAESSSKTPWHHDHIAERYGLLTIIVLGESVLAATNAVQIAIDEQGAGFEALMVIISGGLLILFSMWWLYFSKSAEEFLNKKSLVSFKWGYGHYFIFATAAIVGAGIAVNVDHITGHTALTNIGAAASITIPVAIFLFSLWLLHIRPHKPGVQIGLLYNTGAVLVLLTTYSEWAVLLSGIITAAMVAIQVASDHNKHQKALS